MTEPVILCVDDEEIVLESLEIELSEKFGNDYVIEIAQGAEEALEIVEELIDEGREITVVISDYIMPEVKGDELLRKIHEMSPRTIKIMLTGQASMEGVTNAINNARLYRYITKPWQKEDLSLTISEANRTFFQDKLLEEQNKRLVEKNDQLKELNSTLEQKVEERTTEIVHQKAELEKKNNNITASIRYAQRIQNAILPNISEIQREYLKPFIFFRPRDIVSGDFYWFSHNEETNQLIIAAADCTGHGVPGAFMSFIGIEQLTEIVTIKKVTQADEILNQLHQGVLKVLQHGDGSVKDGMDIALCVINLDSKTMDFAGAKNPLIYIQDGHLKQIVGDKLAIGGNYLDQTTFTKQTIDVSTLTTCYLFSDGFQDQFGGPKGRKFMKHNFRELLYIIHHRPVENQEQILNDTLNHWISFPVKYGEAHKQIDDIVVVGFQIDL
ncbi:PP2C family protein-serine/threonine phosphatase [Microscilla marina]|uniref:Serine/threonine protein kinases n=1 Tax=Microscilla marina ATCC 23134 TaxID=313606 RepID=A1ZH50_MICM2|nr:response regulator [Microscilla marina]EAY30319.1 serine/threonine protein kinases [Microscilla marina ATCC 23134]